VLKISILYLFSFFPAAVMVRYDLILSLLATVVGVTAKPEKTGAIPGAFMFEFEEGAVSTHPYRGTYRHI
jgi:hypothetical protein